MQDWDRFSQPLRAVVLNPGGRISEHSRGRMLPEILQRVSGKIHMQKATNIQNGYLPYSGQKILGLQGKQQPVWLNTS